MMSEFSKFTPTFKSSRKSGVPSVHNRQLGCFKECIFYHYNSASDDAKKTRHVDAQKLIKFR